MSSRKSTPPSFIEIKVVEDGRAIDKIQISKSNLKALTLKSLGAMPWKDTDKTPLFMATGREASDFFKKLL